MLKFSSAQISAINSVTLGISRGNKRIFLQMPAASGRTAVITQIINHYLNIRKNVLNKAVLVVADNPKFFNLFREYARENLPEMKLVPLGPQISAGNNVVLTSLDNLQMGSYPAGYFDFIIIVKSDELSVRIANSKLFALLDYFKAAFQLAVSTDVVNLSPHFGNPIFSYPNASDMVAPVLLPIIYHNLSAFRALDAKWNENDDYLTHIATGIIDYCYEEKTIVVCKNVKQAELLKRIINSKFKYQYAELSAPELDKARHAVSFKNFSADSQIMVLLLTGVPLAQSELPSVKCIVLLENIGSVRELAQILYIGIHQQLNKFNLKLVDFSDNFELLTRYGEEYSVNIQDKRTNTSSRGEPAGQSEPVGEVVAKVGEYFSKTAIFFRDRKDIEGVLEVKDLAEELAEIIQIIPAEQGSMIGVFGKWGRGKTFLMQETWKELSKLGYFKRVDFHAWKYQDTPASWAYLYECLSDAYYQDSKPGFWRWLHKPGKTMVLNFKRKGWLPILKFIGIAFLGIIVTVITSKFSLSKENPFAVLNFAGPALAVLVTIYTILKGLSKEYSAKAKDLFLKYSSKHSFKEHLGIQAEIQKETQTLLKVWIPEKKLGKKKIVLIVEDIDRCHEGKIIQIIDALKILLEDEQIAQRIVIMAAIDERILKLAIKNKYHGLVSLGADRSDTEKSAAKKSLSGLTNEYIDKLFIAGLKLGDLSAQERDEFFSELSKNDRVGLVAVQQDADGDSLDVVDSSSFEQGSPLIEVSLGETNAGIYSKSGERVRQTAENETLNDKLSEREFEVLKECLKFYHYATPRQIRIFYYRYLLAKNLIIRQYQHLNRSNIWLTAEYCKILGTLIILYTQSDEKDLIAAHKVLAMDVEEEHMEIQLLEKTSVLTLDYQLLLKVLDVVIAY